MRFMSQNGSSWVRFGITTNATGSSSLDMALQTIRWARGSALMVDIFFYLSSVGADLGKQPAPLGWERKPVAERAALAREHIRSSVVTLLQENASDHFYEVGNEIDYGVCGSFVSDQAKWPETRANIEFLKATVWVEEAFILREAIAGLREADANATVVLHLSHWWNLTFCHEFFDFMRSQGVAFDVAGISYYPSSGIYDLGEFLGPTRKTDADASVEKFRSTVTGLTDLGYRVMICEFAYPSTPIIPGPFSYFDKQVSGYPLSPEGQAKFIEDTLLWLCAQPNVVGALYFAPHFYETYLTDVWGAFAWFDEEGEARPAAFSLGKVVSQRSDLVAQRDARETILGAWDAIGAAQSAGRTDGLSTARLKADEAWRSYLKGMFGSATASAGEAIEAANSATNPTARAVFIALVGAVATLAALSMALVLVALRLRKRQVAQPPPDSLTQVSEGACAVHSEARNRYNRVDLGMRHGS
jgi:arabinogalactan endo-1,4-beta-galactosidase